MFPRIVVPLLLLLLGIPRFSASANEGASTPKIVCAMNAFDEAVDVPSGAQLGASVNVAILRFDGSHIRVVEVLRVERRPVDLRRLEADPRLTLAYAVDGFTGRSGTRPVVLVRIEHRQLDDFKFVGRVESSGYDPMNVLHIDTSQAASTLRLRC